MKTIILVRHGKSSWEFDVLDRERPLKRRGEEDAKLVASQFIRLYKLPNKIYSSPAKRALSTCKIFTEIFDLPEKSINVVEELYDFSGENVIYFIESMSNELDTVMIFGHNHAFTSISNNFGSIFIENLPTSGLVKINFDIDNWKAIKSGKTELLLIPKELKK
jgi:phosphohistidine phosphatase